MCGGLSLDLKIGLYLLPGSTQSPRVEQNNLSEAPGEVCLGIIFHRSIGWTSFRHGVKGELEVTTPSGTKKISFIGLTPMMHKAIDGKVIHGGY